MLSLLALWIGDDLDISTLIWYGHHPGMIALLLATVVCAFGCYAIFGGPLSGQRR